MKKQARQMIGNYIAIAALTAGFLLSNSASAQTAAWGHWTLVPVPGSYPPSLTGVAPTTYQGKLVLVGIDTGHYVRVATFNGSTWSAWSYIDDLPEVVADAQQAPATAEFNGRLYVFCRSGGIFRYPAGQILYKSFDGSTWSSWAPVTIPTPTPYVPTSTQGVAVAGLARLNLFWRDDAGGLSSDQFDGSAWSTTIWGLGKTTDYAPTVTQKMLPQPFPSPPIAELFLLTRAQDGLNWDNISADGLHWDGWTPVPPTVAGLVASGAVCSGPTVFIMGYDPAAYGIYHNYSLDGGITWSGWALDPDAATTAWSLAAVEFNGDLYEFGNLFSPAAAAGISYRVFRVQGSVNVVNMIPNSNSDDSADDISPDLAVSPAAPSTVVACSSRPLVPEEKFFTTSSGVSSWSYLPGPSASGENGDATLKWSSGGTLYAAMSTGIGLSGHTFSVWTSAGGGTWTFSASLPSLAIEFVAGHDVFGNPITISYPVFPYHPMVDVAQVAGADRAYVGFMADSLIRDNPDVEHGGSARVWYSLDAGAPSPSWHFSALPLPPPGIGDRGTIDQLPQDGNSPVRVAVSSGGTKVYALFNRYLAPYGPSTGPGEVVVMRDDVGGANGFANLGIGTVIPPTPDASVNLAYKRLPWRMPLHDDRDAPLPYLFYEERNAGAIAVDPGSADHVYVAAVYLDTNSIPRVGLWASTSGGATFSSIYHSAFEADTAVNPALAVAANGAVGLLCKEGDGNSSTSRVHLIQGFDFVNPLDLILASGPKRLAGTDAYHAVYGQHQDLEAVGTTFYGVFSFDNHPDPAHFPSGVFYQRDVSVGGTILHDQMLTQSGSLANRSAPTRPPSESLDPFFFFVPAISLTTPPVIYHDVVYHPDGNKPGELQITWLEGPQSSTTGRSFGLESSPALGPLASWSPANASVSGSNGQFTATVPMLGTKMFYRLHRPPPGTNTLYSVNAFAGGPGTISPKGNLPAFVNSSLAFTAQPNTNCAVEAWYVDGALAQTGGSGFTLANIQANHTVSAVFRPLYDLWVSKVAEPPAGVPVRVGSNVTFTITAVNQGLNPATGVTIVDTLPSELTFVSADASQGNWSYANGTVTCQAGGLAPGASMTLAINATAANVSLVTNTAWVYGDQPDADPVNNQAATVVWAGMAPLVPAGAYWRYHDDGADLGTAWRGMNYSDVNWKYGPAKLGFGRGDEATVVDSGPSPTNHYMTTYFRRTFQVTDPADYSSLLLELKRDDGGVVYLNGNEVFRSNMPNSPVNYLTPAASTTTGPDENTFFSTALSSNLLYAGDNVLAVEVHQDSPASDDLGFDLQLTGYLAAPQAPSILQQPQSQTVKQGDTTSFFVQAAGTAPLSYQWYFNNALVGGATSSIFSIDNVQSDNAGIYQVQVRNAFGSASSTGAVLVVGEPPTMLLQPQSQTVSAGKTAIFTSFASGTAPLSYQWSFNNGLIGGATSTIFSIDKVQTNNAGIYQVEVTNAFGSASSTGASLVVLP